MVNPPANRFSKFEDSLCAIKAIAGLSSDACWALHMGGHVVRGVHSIVKDHGGESSLTSEDARLTAVPLSPSDP